jgi:uncharacterized repeat protein (TIGR02543 family)
MTNRSIFSVIVLIFAVFGLFTTCGDPNKDDYVPSVPTYTVSFNANGGSPVPKSQTISQGDKVAEPAPMVYSNPNYGFYGWYKEQNGYYLGGKEWDFDTDTVTADITLYARWEYGSRTYTVNFEVNGGTPAPSQQYIASGSTVIMPPPMIKTGYGFDGWYKEEACINQWDFTIDTVTKNITLYAKWDSNYFTVSFEANGGTPAPSQQNIVNGRTVVIPPAMTKTNYSFDGWYKEPALTNQWDFAADIVTGNIALYAKWLENPIVSFEANGGTPAPQQQIIAFGNKVSVPPVMIKDSLYFEGWYKDEECINLWNFANDVVTGNITLYAKWIDAVLVSGSNWNAKMRWLVENVQSDNEYIIEVDSNESISPFPFSFSGKTNIKITLKGIESKRIISLNGGGSMFTIDSGVTLIIENNLELQGGNPNGSSLVTVNSGGKLIMNNGARITGNTYTTGTASGSHSYGGGVSVYGTFIMNGGEISGNTATTTSAYTIYFHNSLGGGVYVSSGSFTMNGGKISGNTVSSFSSGSSSESYGGGGVYMSSGTFTMNGGEISNNTVHSNGGGVSVSDGTFTMSGGKISGNTASGNYSCGGGVYMGFRYDGRGTFTMSGGEISGNTAASSGGGVYVESDYNSNSNVKTFTMSGGEISGNTASSYGGGVYMGERTIINKIGGTVFGFSSGDSKSNAVKDNSGAVLSNRGHAVHVNNNNSIYIMGKDTTSGPTDNLSFDGTVTPPSYSGEWDY